MSNFLRKLDDTLHIPDRIIHGIQETARGSSKEETPGGGDESSRTSDRPGEGLRQGEGGYDSRGKPSQSSGGPMDVVRSGLSELAPSVGNPMGTSGSYGDESSRYQGRESNPFAHSSYSSGSEGRTHQYRDREQQSQMQRSGQLPRELGATQVRPDDEQPYPNPTGGIGYSGHGSFPGAQPSKQSWGGDRDREGETYGRRGPDADRDGGARYRGEDTGGWNTGSEGRTGRGSGGQQDYGKSGYEDELHVPGDFEDAAQGETEGPITMRYEGEDVGPLREPAELGIAAHHDVEGSMRYEGEGAGRREYGRRLAGDRGYDRGDSGGGGGSEGPIRELGIAAHRDVEGPMRYEGEGVGRREEGRTVYSSRGYEVGQRSPMDVGPPSYTIQEGLRKYESGSEGQGWRRSQEGQSQRENTVKELNELGLDRY